MIEFGSDYHYCAEILMEKVDEWTLSNATFFANGRHALQTLILNKNWKRIWVPTYICYEFIDAIKETGIIVELYPDAPTFDDVDIILNITFKDGDVLLRINFFGLRMWRDSSMFPVPVIEDHSHDLLGSWSMYSNAEWCFGSLRKTIPLPEGGILWSPKYLKQPPKTESSTENEMLSLKRLSAMMMKTLYLSNILKSKKNFRALFHETEDAFVGMKQSGISDLSLSILKSMNISNWYKRKSANWSQLASIKNERVRVLTPENLDNCNPYSFILEFRSIEEREAFREKCMKENIYTALLWQIPENKDDGIVFLSQRLLSVYCDARYDSKDVEYLKKKMIELLN